MPKSSQKWWQSNFDSRDRLEVRVYSLRASQIQISVFLDSESAESGAHRQNRRHSNQEGRVEIWRVEPSGTEELVWQNGEWIKRKPQGNFMPGKRRRLSSLAE